MMIDYAQKSLYKCMIFFYSSYQPLLWQFYLKIDTTNYIKEVTGFKMMNHACSGKNQKLVNLLGTIFQSLGKVFESLMN